MRKSGMKLRMGPHPAEFLRAAMLELERRRWSGEISVVMHEGGVRDISALRRIRTPIETVLTQDK